ncbi:carboxylesterase type B [Corynebacterium kutscheri]|uniref:Carboxylic ester hydrolase n=1 Tax=Corynebacterium kutscheri TaxID=35755 RepID=A0A0F6R2J0_9CORY|nr:carboxylesterase/lipase family protein [Corynebacterium kutscheri]AKE41688.1 carboxylesterase type B [Corynebacterium kutscheri]VEH10015.1 putative type B carboxylesterase [Corynebacterium kutscheri]
MSAKKQVTSESAKLVQLKKQVKDNVLRTNRKSVLKKNSTTRKTKKQTKELDRRVKKLLKTSDKILVAGEEIVAYGENLTVADSRVNLAQKLKTELKNVRSHSVKKAHPGLVIKTTAGYVQGLFLDAPQPVRTWRGVPYGADTGGDNRFRAPQPVPPWQGVKVCDSYGSVALQPTYRPSDKLRGSEDCLNLDIVRPDTDETLPVVVYLHGGSFIYGSSHEQLLRGHFLAPAMNVVYVSVNFRLGALGFLDMRALGDDCVANPALMDQLLALRWVKENIAAFGGNPSNVTLMGESAGANNVLTLMCVPAAQGLFHKAIAQSPPIAAIHSRAQSVLWALELARRSGLARSATLADVRALDAEVLVKAGQTMMWRSREILLNLNVCYSPTVDNNILFDHPINVFTQGNQHKIPLLIGTNIDEASFSKGLYVRSAARSKAALRMLTAFDPVGAPTVFEAYNGAEIRKDFADFLSDAVFWAPSVQIATAHSSVADTWMYRFDFASMLLKMIGLGAMHATELTPVFGDLNGSRMAALNKLGGRAALYELTQHMQKEWAEFIHHSATSTDWPRYALASDTTPGRATRIFDREVHTIYDPRSAYRQAWQNYDVRMWGMGRPELLEELGVELVDEKETKALPAPDLKHS